MNWAQVSYGKIKSRVSNFGECSKIPWHFILQYFLAYLKKYFKALPVLWITKEAICPQGLPNGRAPDMWKAARVNGEGKALTWRERAVPERQRKEPETRWFCEVRHHWSKTLKFKSSFWFKPSSAVPNQLGARNGHIPSKTNPRWSWKELPPLDCMPQVTQYNCQMTSAPPTHGVSEPQIPLKHVVCKRTMSKR